MPDNVNASVTQQQEAVKANWGAISEDFGEVGAQTTPIKTENVDIQTKDNAETTEIQDATLKPEEKKEDVKPEVKDEVKEEVKTEVAKDVKTDEVKEEPKSDFDLTVDDIKDAPKTHEDGSWLKVAQDLGGEIKEDSFEALQQMIKENFVPKTEAEKITQTTLDDIYATLKNPETAVALKLMEMGVPEASVFEANKEIDSYLSLEPIDLIRADLESRASEGWTKELIDAKLEELNADQKKLALMDGEIRIGLNQQKKSNTETRNRLLQQYEQQKQESLVNQKKQESAHFNGALDKVQTFMGRPISKEIKEVIRAKYNNGSYSDFVKNPAAIVDAIMYKEFGDKMVKHIQNKASEDAKFQQTTKLLNVPPVKTGNSGQKVELTNQNQNDNNWGAIVEDFKGK